MSDDLMEELKTLLNVDEDKFCNETTKLQSYFGDENEKDDLFGSILNDSIIQRSFDKKINDKFQSVQSCENPIENGRKSVCISDNFDIEIEKSNSFNNVIYDNYLGSAWLNSENTKKILAKIISKDIDCSNVNKSLLARPQLYTDQNQKLIDPLFSLIAENFNYETALETRHIPTFDEINSTEKDVLLLIEKGWIRPAIDLTSKILNKMGYTYGQGYSMDNTSTHITVESGRLWSLRFTLLARMKLVSILESELSGFQSLDCPNLYKEFYSNSTVGYVKGSLIPFSMRLLHAELPLFFNKFSEALNRLYYILAVIKRILINLERGYSEDGTNLCTDQSVKTNALKLWQKRRTRVLISCMRVLIASKDYPSVIDVIHDLINKSRTDISISYSEEALYHLLGRVYLQLGNIESAGIYFQQSLNILNETAFQGDVAVKNDIIQTKLTFQNALMNISRSNFDEAKRGLQHCLELNPHSPLILNNYAVCCLYTKQVPEATSILEKLIQNGIRHDGLIFNLCILYELQTNQIKNKKLKLVKMLARFPGDDFNISSFKLTNSE